MGATSDDRLGDFLDDAQIGHWPASLRSVSACPRWICVLVGPFEASFDGHAVELGSRIQRCVLALLTASFEETISADRLLFEIWGASPLANPRNPSRPMCPT